MAAIAYDADHQDQIALRVWNRLYAALSTEQKKLVDGTWTTGSLANGHAFDVLTQVRRYAHFIQMDGSDSGPDDAWLGWFLAETVARCVYNQNRERFREAKGMANDAMKMALTTYTRSEVDETTDVSGFVHSHINTRRFVLDNCVRLEPMLLPTPERIDGAMRTVYARIWNMSDWWFKRRQVTFTVDTAGDVTDDLAGTEVAHAVSSERLFYDDTNNRGGEIHHISASEMAREQSLSHDAGRPLTFRAYRTGSGLQWTFDRTPDQSYTFRGEVFIRQPALATAANFDTALTILPPEHHDALRDMILSHVVSGYMHKAGPDLRFETEAYWKPFLDKSQDIGEPDSLPLESQTKATFHALMNQGGGFSATIGGSL